MRERRIPKSGQRFAMYNYDVLSNVNSDIAMIEPSIPIRRSHEVPRVCLIIAKDPSRWKNLHLLGTPRDWAEQSPLPCSLLRSLLIVTQLSNTVFTLRCFFR